MEDIGFVETWSKQKFSPERDVFIHVLNAFFIILSLYLNLPNSRDCTLKDVLYLTFNHKKMMF